MINENYFLMIVALLAVGTIAIRGSFIAFAGKMNLSPKMKELFTYIPGAILPALIVPGAFYQPGKERFLILIAASIFCYFIRNTLAVISFGLVLLYVLTNI